MYLIIFCVRCAMFVGEVVSVHFLLFIRFVFLNVTVGVELYLLLFFLVCMFGDGAPC